MAGTLLSIGHGYSAQALAARLVPRGWRIIATTRRESALAELRDTGVTPILWPGTALRLDEATHLLSSVPPGEAGDPVIAACGAAIAGARHLDWVGYLSTVGVYGDHGGAWVDEDTPPAPSTARGRARVAAEAAWQEVCGRAGVRLHVIRLAGIYGPGRGPFAKLRAGRAQRIVKPGQVFSRIHVEDIARALELAMTGDAGSDIFNLCDDVPAPPQDVLAHAAELLGIAPPPEIPFDQADLSPMARSFYSESKRVRNDRIKRALGLELRYPEYRSGLAAVLRLDG